MLTLIDNKDGTWAVRGDTHVDIRPSRGALDLDFLLTSMLYRDGGKDWRWDPSTGAFVENTPEEPAAP